MLTDIIRKLTEEGRWLHRVEIRTHAPMAAQAGAAFAETTANHIRFNDAQIAAMLRVEVARQHEADIWEEIERNSPDMLYHFREHARGGRHGPYTILGIALYYVDTLPPPGWRVISPMRLR